MRFRKSWLAAAAAIMLAGVLFLPATSLYYESSGGESCARCHEIRPTYLTWRNSSHRSIACESCHGGLLTLDARFHINNLHRVAAHLRGGVSEQIRLRGIDVPRMVERCRSCHRQEFADWQSGPHGGAFSRVFLNAEHNRKRLLIDDCLRCHGAYFEGAIRDLVTPIDTRGPWRFLAPEWSERPAVPCLNCHQMHREGAPLKRADTNQAAAGQELSRPSLALFDRREMAHVPLARLSLPAMREGERVVRMSPDARQALCYQCHAPLSTAQAGSGDDRTGLGVHEGISCLACHLKHGQKTRASCASCHPRLSNCGLDVEKMDTTFRSPKSPHNVHFVKCVDCHVRGVPRRRSTVPGSLLTQTLPGLAPAPAATRPASAP